MSLMKTKPKWCPFAEASEQGWINLKTGELLVSLRGLKSKLEAETQIQEEVKTEVEQPVHIEEIIVDIQEEVKTEVEQPVQIEEETIKKPKKKQKLLGEVVEFKITPDQEVIGE